VEAVVGAETNQQEVVVVGRKPFVRDVDP
jgi:hypothetical protein